MFKGTWKRTNLFLDAMNKSNKHIQKCTPENAGEIADEMNMPAMAVMKAMLHEVLQEYGLDTIKNDMQDLKNSVENASAIGKEAKSIAISNKSDIDTLKSELEQVKRELRNEHEARLRNECQARRSNLLFCGVPEQEKETDQK